VQLAVRTRPSVFARMADAREPLRQWLRSIARTKSTTLSAIAKSAGVAQSSVTRFVNDPAYEFELSARTIRKIEEQFHVQAPRSQTFSDNQAQAFEARETPFAARSFELVMAADDALNLAGVRRGDLCEVDAAAPPHAGDLVAVELRPGLRSRETIVRVWDPPYLMAHASNYDLNRPILFEPGRARILGIVRKVTRQLREG
jgi:hypothetical protein